MFTIKTCIIYSDTSYLKVKPCFSQSSLSPPPGPVKQKTNLEQAINKSRTNPRAYSEASVHLFSFSFLLLSLLSFSSFTVGERATELLKIYMRI